MHLYLTEHHALMQGLHEANVENAGQKVWFCYKLVDGLDITEKNFWENTREKFYFQITLPNVFEIDSFKSSSSFV